MQDTVGKVGVPQDRANHPAIRKRRVAQINASQVCTLEIDSFQHVCASSSTPHLTSHGISAISNGVSLDDKSKNPFAYFTQIIHYAFLRRIQKEKKQVSSSEYLTPFHLKYVRSYVRMYVLMYVRPSVRPSVRTYVHTKG